MSAHRRPGRGAEQSAEGGLLLAVAVVVSALNLRTAVTSVGALLAEVEADLDMSPEQVGLVTALPLVTFAVVGWHVARLGRRFGDRTVLLVSMYVMTLGLVLRALASEPVSFLAATCLSLVGGAVGNVAVPTIIKAHFPDRIGAMTAAYTVAMAAGQSLAAGFSIPIARAGTTSNWRVGIGIWALMSLLAIAAWFVSPRPAQLPGGNGHGAVPIRLLIRSQTVWLTTAYFALQSAQVFVVFGWFTTYFRDTGVDATTAASLVSVYALLVIPVSLIIPLVIARVQNQVVIFSGPGGLRRVRLSRYAPVGC